MPKEVTCPKCEECFQTAPLEEEHECPTCGTRFASSSKRVTGKSKTSDDDDDGKGYDLAEPETSRPAPRTPRRSSRNRRRGYEEDDERDSDRSSPNDIFRIAILISCGVYLLFLLISLLWHPLAAIPLLIALSGAVAYTIIFHAIIIQNEGLLFWLLILIISPLGLIYILMHLDELGVPWLKSFGCWIAFWLSIWSLSETNLDAQPVAPVNIPGANAQANSPATNDPAKSGANPKRPKEPKNRPNATPTEDLLIDGKVHYLSDLNEFDWVKGPVIWGWSFGKNGDLGDSAHSRIVVNRRKYSKGLGMIPPDPPQFTSISYRLDGAALRLIGAVALDDSQSPFAPGRFEVIGDDRSLWKSEPIGKNGVIEKFDIDVKGVKVIQLHVFVEGFTNTGCCAVWLDPYLVME